MIAKVTGIKAGSEFADGKRRVTLLIERADTFYKTLQVAEESLDLGVPVALDDELELTVGVRRVRKARAS